jgi:tetratricopeptide (TPR) repeat protein
LLVERAGGVVTREELQDKLWAADTFVDFDIGLNSVIRKLRDALGDSAENPKFIETLPKRGYRFIASVKPATADQIPQPEARGAARAGSRVRLAWIAGGLVLAAAIGTLALALERGWRARPSAVKPEAYDAYLKGVSVAGRGTYDGFRLAVAYFEDAVARQPDFAMAHAAMAQAQLQFLFNGPLSPRETIPKAEAAARKALRLDETLALPHRTLGEILHKFYWQWEEGDKEFARARDLSANSVDTQPIAEALIRSRRFEAAIGEAARVRKLDPRSFSASINLAVAYRAAGRYDHAIEEVRRALEITPGQPRAHFQLGVTFLFMDRLNQAIRELETAVRSAQAQRGNPRFQAYLGYAYAAAGRPLDARRILNELESLARQQYVSSFGLALIHDALGEKEPALAALERAHQDRAVEFAQMAQYPPFKTIAAEPRFQGTMRQVGLPR